MYSVKDGTLQSIGGEVPEGWQVSSGMERLEVMLSVVGDDCGDEVDWAAVERVYGVNFPQDYKEFLTAYGSGEVDGMLAVFAPALASEPGERCVERLPEEVRELPEANEWASPDHATRHTVDDILVWGETVEADVLGWIAVGQPEEWPVAVYSHGGSWAVYECAMTEFLLRLISRDFDGNPTGLTRLFGAGSARFGCE